MVMKHITHLQRSNRSLDSPSRCGDQRVASRNDGMQIHPRGVAKDFRNLASHILVWVNISPILVLDCSAADHIRADATAGVKPPKWVGATSK